MLLITGAPASGKSRLASALAPLYPSLCLSKDLFKEVLFDRLGEIDAAWSRRLSDACFALMFALAPRLLQGGRLLMLEGNFRAGEHERPLRALMDAKPVRCAQILCVAAPSTRGARLARRAMDPERHPGHRDRPSEVADNAAFLDLPGERWRFDSDAEEPDELQRLRAHLNAWQAGD